MTTRLLNTALRQNLYYALGIVVMKGVSLFMLPFIAHRLSPEAFGQLEILTSLGALGAILVGFGLLNTLFRYAGATLHPAQQRALVATMVNLNLLIGALALLIGLACAAPLARILPGDVERYSVSLMVMIIALDACISLPLGWLRMNDRAKLFFALNSLKAMIQALLVVWFLHMERGVNGVLEAGVIASVLLAASLLYLQIRDTGFAFEWPRVPDILRYSIPLIGSGLLGFMLSGLDRWILADAVGAAAMAQYAIAAKFAMIAALLLQPFLMWWSPRRFEVLNHPEGTAKAAHFAALGCTLSLLIAVAIGLIGPLLIYQLLPQTYWQAASYVPWLVMIVAIKDSAELLNLGCYTGKSTTSQLYINLAGTAAGLTVMLVLVPYQGIHGAIIALILAQLVRLALYLSVSQRQLYLPYPHYRLLALAGLALGLLVLATQLHTLTNPIGPTAMALAVMVCATVLLSKPYALRVWKVSEAR